MTTVINSGGKEGEGSGVGLIVGIILAIIIVFLFVMYGLPAMRGSGAPKSGSLDVNVSMPDSVSSPAQ